MGENTNEYRRKANAWELLFKVNQVLLPMMLTWAIWVTVQLFSMDAWRAQGERFTHKDGELLEARILATSTDIFPSKEVLETIKEQQVMLRRMENEIVTLRAQVGRVFSDKYE